LIILVDEDVGFELIGDEYIEFVDVEG